MPCRMPGRRRAMRASLRGDEVFGFLRPSVDAHTLGISSVEQLLADCGYASVHSESHRGCDPRPLYRRGVVSDLCRRVLTDALPVGVPRGVPAGGAVAHTALARRG